MSFSSLKRTTVSRRESLVIRWRGLPANSCSCRSRSFPWHRLVPLEAADLHLRRFHAGSQKPLKASVAPQHRQQMAKKSTKTPRLGHWQMIAQTLSVCRAGSLSRTPQSKLTVQRLLCNELALGNDTVHAAGSMLRCDDRSVLCGQNEREAGSS